MPEGSDYSAISYEPGRGDVAEFTKATLPEVYLERRGSRGFEAWRTTATTDCFTPSSRPR